MTYQAISDPDESHKGHITRLEYKQPQQTHKSTDPLNNITTNTYDKNGNRISQTDGNATPLPLNITTGAGNKGNRCAQRYHYICLWEHRLSLMQRVDKLTTVTDAKGQTTTFEYNLLGNLIKKQVPLGNITAYTYDASGNLKTKTDANANTITYSYDIVNRLTQKLYPDGNTAAYQYDTRGRLTQAQNQHIGYTYQYDANGRITGFTDSASKTLQYAYDANSNRTSMIDPTGGVASYAYNALNLVASITNPSGKQFRFTYDSLGRRTNLRHPNRVQTTYTYDSNSRLTSLITFNSKLSTLNSFTYTYDKVSNRTTT